MISINSKKIWEYDVNECEWVFKEYKIVSEELNPVIKYKKYGYSKNRKK